MTDHDHYLAASTAFKENKLEAARSHAGRCLALRSDHAAALFLLGLIDRRTGNLPGALAHFAAAARADPAFPDPPLLAGMTFHQLGNPTAAIDALRHCLSLDPNQVQALTQLGRVFIETGQFGPAETPLRRAVALDPKSATARILLGDALRNLRRLDEAVTSYRDASTADPNSADAAGRLGASLAQLGRSTEAETSLRRAIALNPAQATARYNLAKILLDSRRLDEAAAEIQAALHTRPDYPDARSLLGNLLGLAGRVPEAIAQQRLAVAKKPDPGVASNLLLSLNYLGHFSRAEVFAAHQEWATRFAPPVEKPSTHAGPGRLRIGYVSPNFSSHSVAYFIEPVLAAHDRSLLEIFCYADTARPDSVTRRLQSTVEHWRPITGQSTAQVVAKIKQDRIDVLIDLAGHTAENRLPVFAAAPAPVQATYLGYPNTTGLPTMDYRITDAVCDPPADENFGTEKLLRIPGGMWAYKPPTDAPPVGPPPVVRNGYVTFGSFNNLPKLTPVVLGRWGEILKRIPSARLVLKSLGFAGTWGREYTLSHLTQTGIDPARITLLAWTPTTIEHLNLYDTIDVALDPFPYNGTTTTCETLWTGVPVVTLAGSTTAGRVGASLLGQLGMGDWVADDQEKYVDRAVAAASDVPKLISLRRGLRKTISDATLTDGRRVAGALEEFYKEMTKGRSRIRTDE